MKLKSFFSELKRRHVYVPRSNGRAIALTPLEKDVVNSSRVLQYFAITATWVADKECALQQLEAGLRAPAASQDPLRGDPRFEKIVESLAPKENAASSKK